MQCEVPALLFEAFCIGWPYVLRLTVSVLTCRDVIIHFMCVCVCVCVCVYVCMIFTLTKTRASGRNFGKVFNPVVKLVLENQPFLMPEPAEKPSHHSFSETHLGVWRGQSPPTLVKSLPILKFFKCIKTLLLCTCPPLP